MKRRDSTTLTDTSATSDSITKDSSDNNDYAEDSLSPSSSFSPIEESDHDYDGAIEPYVEPIASDSSNSTDEHLSQDEERLHNTNWLVVILLVRCGIVRWLHS